MTTEPEQTELDENDELYDGPSKSQVKRDCYHLLEVGDSILKLNNEDRRSLNLPAQLEEAINAALKIKSHSALKRQRQYIGKLLRSIDSETIETQLNRILHRHDTNTAQFKRLEKWRDRLIDNDKQALDEVITHYQDIDRQHINQLIRVAQQELKQNKPPSAARKLFKYLRQLEESQN